MSMLTIREFTYEELKAQLKRSDRIAIVSCNSCARLSNGLGGETGMNSLANKLISDGFTVVTRRLVAKSCVPDLMTGNFQTLENIDVVIPLSCITGNNTTEKLLPGARILRVTRSIGKGPGDEHGEARLTRPFDSAPVDVGENGMPLSEVARRMGKESGPY